VKDSLEIRRDSFTKEEWDAKDKTVDLFGRMKDTKQAELVATVLYVYDQLCKTRETEGVTDKEVYDEVLAWKPHWKDNDFELCDAIHHLSMLSCMNAKYTGLLTNTLDFND